MTTAPGTAVVSLRRASPRRELPWSLKQSCIHAAFLSGGIPLVKELRKIARDRWERFVKDHRRPTMDRVYTVDLSGVVVEFRQG